MRLKRLTDYKPTSRGINQCPRCWINNGAVVDLYGIPSDTPNDLFSCPTCDLRVEIEWE